MSSTLSDHLASDENAAGVVACHPGATDASDDVSPGQNGGSLVRDEPTEDAPPACRPSCGEQLAEFQLRITDIERRLEELLAGGCDDIRRPPDFRASDLEFDRDPTATPESPIADSSSVATRSPNTAAYTAVPVGDDGPSPPPADEGDRSSDPSDRPTWAAAYQSDDVDESVRDYVERLLQRMSTDEDKRTGHSERPVEATNDACQQGLLSSLDATTGPTESDARPQQDDSDPCPPPLGAAQPAQPAEDPLVASTSNPNGVTAASKAHESHDIPRNVTGESLNFAQAELYAPRSLPPERLANLAEMRELANMSATAAIRTFEKSRAAKHAFDRLPLMMVGLSCGLFLLYFATICDGQMMQLLLYAGVGISFLAATTAAGQALSVLYRWMAAAKKPTVRSVGDSNTSDGVSTDGC